MISDKESNKYSKIKSYVKRNGHISKTQVKAIIELMPKWGITYQEELLNLNQIFSRDNSKILEIGFGMGNTTLEIAKEMPHKDFLVIDIYKPGIGNLLKLMEQEKVDNIRIIEHDAVEVVEKMLPQEILSGIHIFFPDPWPKKRHQKRRLIQDNFVDLLIQRLKNKGYIHLATDWEDYAYQMLEVFDNNKLLINRYSQFAPRPKYRSSTKFEEKGRKQGHDVWDLIFEKI